MPSTLHAHIPETIVELSTQFFSNVIDFLKNKNIKTMIDAGGCTGQVSIFFLEKIDTIKEIKIIEPVQSNYDFIIERTKQNKKIEVFNNALFYGESHIQLGQCDDNVGGWSFAHANNKTKPVKTITLEDFKNIDLIKLDIEGAEINVLEHSIAIHSVPYLLIEFHNELYLSWREYTLKNLKNHILTIDGAPDRPQHGFFIRKDLANNTVNS